LGPPPHGPLLEWQSENGHLKKVHPLNSHQEVREPPRNREHPYSHEYLPKPL
jgi:hypothetical protein